MKLSQRLMSSAIVLLMGAGLSLGAASSAFSQSPAPDKAAATAPAAADSDKPDKKAPIDKKAAMDKKALSKECSEQATAKGLHGKERKTFRAECKKNGGKPT
jgi:hypothetical protein